MPGIVSSRAYERQIIEGFMTRLGYGEVITYADLSDALSADVLGLRHLVTRVRDDLKSAGYLFEVVKNVGYRRMTDVEISTVVPASRRRKIRSQAKRGAQDLAAIVKPEDLTEQQRTAALIGLSLFGAIAAITTHKAIKAIAANVERTRNALPVAETLEAFRDIG